ncbi:mobile mystery protein B [Variovorax ginsengisoli]|uniref:Fic-DOC domain mobile mystery protein B n=1 Tax=Variovorax ginsengisoli TaxID=363844 RepID=A0ABT9SBG5_9BURK|nr:mobile mystery protein B [Variovorax ginsengisoli]MDP9900722.1 Fic-DOC domain mobile mystery protein B [Variovorax ginsengisoli]
MEFVYAPGQTPLDLDEIGGLKPRHITTQEQLNAWEQVNILAGRVWAFRQKKAAVLEENFIRRLHLKMFGDTWTWAGTFRQTDKSIGVPSEQVAMRLTQLLENTRYQRDHAAFPPDELVIRFHHQLVFIHPFANGNGRHSRLMADILGQRLGCPAFTWGAGVDLFKPRIARQQYPEALRAADRGNIAPLLAFARS